VSSDGIAIVFALVGAMVVGGIFVVIIICTPIYGFRVIQTPAAAVIRPSIQPVQLVYGWRPPLRRVYRSRYAPRRRLWARTPFQTWNARQWYRPDPEMRLLSPPPEPFVWQPRSRLSPAAGSSRDQNWYSPAYYGVSSGQNSRPRRQQYYYKRAPHVRRTNASFCAA